MKKFELKQFMNGLLIGHIIFSFTDEQQKKCLADIFYQPRMDESKWDWANADNYVSEAAQGILDKETYEKVAKQVILLRNLDRLREFFNQYPDVATAAILIAEAESSLYHFRSINEKRTEPKDWELSTDVALDIEPIEKISIKTTCVLIS